MYFIFACLRSRIIAKALAAKTLDGCRLGSITGSERYDGTTIMGGGENAARRSGLRQEFDESGRVTRLTDDSVYEIEDNLKSLNT